MKTEYNNPQIGCYFDSARSATEIDQLVIQLAEQYGFAGDLPPDEAEDFPEQLADVAQDAEDFLNNLETRPYLSWQCYDGFGLYPNVDDASLNCEFVSSRRQEFPPDGFTGEWLHVNDHGNCTLYIRDESGEDTEIWSVV